MSNKRGFLLGKFMPPHRGHLFLCKTALEMVDDLTVLVCSTSADDMPGDLRHRWMRDALPRASVIHLHRDLPQAPEDHPDFWNIWRDVINEIHPQGIDCVFGSEPYVFRLAKELGAEPVLVDPERDLFPVSGTAIRKNPAAHWSDIAPTARQYFQKRLCLLGPESTGKSRLARVLARHFKTLYMPEYGRTFDIHYKQGENWTAQDLLTLTKTHAAMRAALAPDAGPLLIEDTDSIQTAIWTEFLLGAPSPAVEEFVHTESNADCYFVLSPDVRWIDDGVRYAGDEDTRRWFFDSAVSRLRALDIEPHIIAGADWSERTAQAMEIADRLFGDYRARD